LQGAVVSRRHIGVLDAIVGADARDDLLAARDDQVMSMIITFVADFQVKTISDT
jgi:hypothetical protein